jgi:hypothetical protein
MAIDIHALQRADIAKINWRAVFERDAPLAHPDNRPAFVPGRRRNLGLPRFTTSGLNVHERSTDDA